jgi:hypothetical protein
VKDITNDYPIASLTSSAITAGSWEGYSITGFGSSVVAAVGGCQYAYAPIQTFVYTDDGAWANQSRLLSGQSGSYCNDVSDVAVNSTGIWLAYDDELNPDGTVGWFGSNNGGATWTAESAISTDEPYPEYIGLSQSPIQTGTNNSVSALWMDQESSGVCAANCLRYSLLTSSGAAPSAGSTLYACTQDGTYGSVNSVTAVFTVLGSTIDQCSGLAYSNAGDFEIADPSGASYPSLYAVNPANGAATLIGPMVTDWWHEPEGLAVSPTNDLLYTVAASGTGVDTLYQIDPTDANLVAVGSFNTVYYTSYSLMFAGNGSLYYLGASTSSDTYSAAVIELNPVNGAIITTVAAGTVFESTCESPGPGAPGLPLAAVANYTSGEAYVAVGCGDPYSYLASSPLTGLSFAPVAGINGTNIGDKMVQGLTLQNVVDSEVVVSICTGSDFNWTEIVVLIAFVCGLVAAVFAAWGRKAPDGSGVPVGAFGALFASMPLDITVTVTSHDSTCALGQSDLLVDLVVVLILVGLAVGIIRGVRGLKF